MGQINFKGAYILAGISNDVQRVIKTISEENAKKAIPTHSEVLERIKAQNIVIDSTVIATGNSDIFELKQAAKNYNEAKEKCEVNLFKNPTEEKIKEMTKCMEKNAKKWIEFATKHGSFIENLFSAEEAENAIKEGKFDTVEGKIVQ